MAVLLAANALEEIASRRRTAVLLLAMLQHKLLESRKKSEA